MRTLSIDIETYSSVDLRQSGVYAYSASPDFTILLFGYAFDEAPARVVDLAQGERIPPDVMDALRDPGVLKTAYNANFERTCLAAYLKQAMPPEQWRCTAVQGSAAGLPGSLELAGRALGLPEDKQKLSTGKALIRYYCTPAKGGTRRTPQDHPERWEQFKEYNRQDVEAERDIKRQLAGYELPPEEQRLWELDQRINDRGVRVDLPLIHQAIRGDQDNAEKRMEEARKETGLSNPGSVAQLKKWIESETGVFVESLNKDKISAVIQQCGSEKVTRVLELRKEMSKTSVKKYAAMEKAVCPDGRIRGLLQFYGGRTGRWAGRLVQVQNLPRNREKDLALARELAREGDFSSLELLFGSIPDLLSQLVRTAFIPSKGCRFIVSDFSAIEARVIAWLADEDWVLNVFRTHGKIYEATASQMFRIPLDRIAKGRPEYEYRQKGKVATLALGYQGGVGALIQMKALEQGLTEEELPGIVSRWRRANPHIVRLWREVENAAIEALDGGEVHLRHGLIFRCARNRLEIRLPSGRKLAYLRPRLDAGPYGGVQLTYEGMRQDKRQWQRLPTYGGKLVENIVQATARDCLAHAMLRLDQEGHRIVFHVHDEVILDNPEGVSSAEEVSQRMGEPIPWAPGLPLRADAYETAFYKKD